MSSLHHYSMRSKIFDIVIDILMAIVTLTCLLPIIHMIAISFSDATAANSNRVVFWPIGFNTLSYHMVLRNPAFTRAFGVSVIRTLAGTALNMVLIVLAAYPLSREKDQLKGRNLIMLYFLLPMLFSGGLVPTFILVNNLHLINTLWSLILPGAVQIGYIVMMMNFFRGINKSLLESAAIDGASEFIILFRIVLPLSMASIATIFLFCMIGQWNEWFSGTIYLNDSSQWPLQTLLKYMMASIDLTKMKPEDVAKMSKLSNRSFRAAQVLFATVPIMCVYPFVQKYFISGVTIGSVKE